MAGTNIRQWFARIFGDCLKGRHHNEAYADYGNGVSKDSTTTVVVTLASSIDISPVHLQPCASVAKHTQDPALWTETNRLVNAAAAWQIRGVMPVNVAKLDYSTLVKMSTPELAWRFKAAPILMVLRADNEVLRELPLELLSAESFAKLTLFEKRAIHNVLAERPTGWNELQLSLYAARERELIVAANDRSGEWCCNQSGQWVYDSFYMVTLPFTYSRYAQEPRSWYE